jgi:hypothetical protein
VVWRQAAAARAIEVGGDLRALDEGPERVRRIVPPDARAGDHRRALGRGEERQCLLHRHRVRRQPRARAVEAGDLQRALVHAVAQDVPGELEEHRPRAAAQRDPEGLGQVERNQIRRRYPVGPLGDPVEEIHLLHLLEAAAALVELRRRTPEEDERRVGRVGVRHPGERVGHARARGDHRHADAAGDPRVCVRGMGGALLVAGVDDLDALLHQARVDRRDVEAGEGEDVPDPLLLEHSRHELPAGHHPHRPCLPPGAWAQAVVGLREVV